MTTRSQVAKFLKAFECEISNSGLIFVRRKKNMDYLASLALFIYEVEEIILHLTEKNYFEGPVVDKDSSAGEIWKFSMDVQGIKTYIKLKLDKSGAKCISFHDLEHRVSFPFEGG